MSISLPTSTLELKRPRRLDLTHFELSRVLGEGSFGRVKFARHRETKNCFAFKLLKKSEVIRTKQVDHLKNEVYILSNLIHPFIVKVEGLAQDPRHLYIAMEFVPGGELFSYLRTKGRFPAPQASFYGAQVAVIFEYLHSNNVIYRDLKPENLLLDPEGYLKLTDFGFAKVLVGRTYTLCGTPEYLAPEILTNKGHGKGVDWWTLGVLLYEMMTGVDPFSDDDPLVIYQNIIKRAFKFPKAFDSRAKSLIGHLLEHDLSKRYGNLKNGAADVKGHRFFEIIDFQSLLKRQVTAPHKPIIKSPNDTSNFATFSSPEEFLTSVVKETEDPFLSW